MNSLEGNRIINVLDEAILDLRLLSFVTESTYERQDLYNLQLSDDAFQALETHEDIMKTNRSDVQSEVALRATTEFLRAFHALGDDKRSIIDSGIEVSEAMTDVVSIFQRLRDLMKFRLDMTVEEERARNEQSLETKERLERNEKENKALTASLKMEREERQKESADLDRHEERLKADTKVVMDRFRRAMAETEDMEAQEKEDDSKYFNLEKERLEKERDELQRKLRRLRAHHADTERDEKEKKTREVNKVQDEVEQYDAIMTEKRGVYEEQKLAAERKADQLHDMTVKIEIMRVERAEFEKAEREEQKRQLRIAARKLRTDMAADVVQKWWRDVLESRKKGKGKKGKK